jgi:hypothetical protein
MRDLIVTVARPSTSHALRQLQQMQGLNEVLGNENISEYSWRMIVFLTMILYN